MVCVSLQTDIVHLKLGRGDDTLKINDGLFSKTISSFFCLFGRMCFVFVFAFI